MTTLTAVCLFDGIGGFPYALALAGIRTVLSCEIDKAARGVIADHYPTHVLHDDVRTLTADDCLAAGFVPRCGILTAGFPCQDLSVAGRLAGLDGARSGLFFEIVRLADALRPRWLLLENVPGLLSACCPCPGDGTHDGCSELHPVTGGICAGGCMASHGGAMGAVLGALAELGYGFAYRVLDAQHFGVPQRRQRVVIVANLGDWAAPAEVLFEPESVRRDLETGSETWPDLTDGTAEGPDGSLLADSGLVTSLTTGLSSGGPDLAHAQAGWLVPALTTRAGSTFDDQQSTQVIPFDLAQVTHPENRANPQPGDPNQPLNATGQPMVAALGQEIAGTLGTKSGGGRTTDLDSHGAYIARALTAEGADASEDGTGRGTPLVAFHVTQDPIRGDVAPALGTGNAQGCGTIGVAYPIELRNATRTHGNTGVGTPGAGIGHAGDPAATIGTNPPPAVGTATAVRRLTPRECERLQGFPDDWTLTSNGKPQADSPRYRQMGNAIATPVFTWVARRLVAVDDRAAA